MSVLPLAALSEMRERVFAERQHVAADAAAGAAPLLHLNLRELLLCGFIENRGAVIISAGFGLVWELGLFDRLVTPLFGQPMTGRGAIRDLARSVMTSATVSWSRLALTVAAFVGVLLLIRLFSMTWAVVRLHGFTLALADGDARSEFGLLTRVATTIPLRRIQALTVREGPLHRVFRRVAVRVDTAGGRPDEENSRGEREYVAPILGREALDAFVQTLVGVHIDAVTWQSPHPEAFRRVVKIWLAVAALVCIAAAVPLRWYAAGLIPFALAWAVVAARQTIRHLGWATTGDAVVFKRGWLWRRTVIVRFAKIQTVTRHETPFDRRTNMARLQVDTAGATAGSIVDIPYLDRRDADSLYAHLAREAAERQFTW
jgi:putative membrane protein